MEPSDPPIIKTTHGRSVRKRTPASGRSAGKTITTGASPDRPVFERAADGSYSYARSGARLFESDGRRILSAIAHGYTDYEEISQVTGMTEDRVLAGVQELMTTVNVRSIDGLVMAIRSQAFGGIEHEVLSAALREKRKRKIAPPLVGDDLEPDPARAQTREEFVTLLREFWQWAGGHATRDLVAWSGGAFSRTTVADLLAHAPRKRPPVTLFYVQSLIRACGGKDDRVGSWTTAWRRLYLP
jgi:hypothetical protein